ncbi:hypothetical protein [Bacteroides sp.]|jgi:hypothetical protein|uniref:hypothetical protein n=1 Tax=Bacteroides sp. TaxID=29523 RepID=UPI002589655F|nr:hypothetical protein [Bacteroides sp.]
MEKEKYPSEEIVKLQKQRIALWCIIAIIGFFLVIQFSLANCGNQELAAQFTFASTISSIILSVIAIIMSVLSSESLNNLIHKSRDLHDEIKDVPTKIELSIKSLDISSAKFEKLSNELLKMPQKIENSIISSINEISQNIENVSGGLKTLNQTVEYGFLEITRNATIGKEYLPIEDKELTVKDVEENFLSSASVIGLFLLIYVAIAHEKSIKVSLVEFSKILIGDESQVEYAYGYLVATSSMGLFFEYEVHEDLYEITKIKTDLLENVKNRLQIRLSEDNYDLSIDEFIDNIR